MSEDEVRELLHEMREDPVPADSLVRVRQAVLAGAPSASGVRWRGFAAAWKVAVVFALAASIAAVIWKPRVSQQTPAAEPPLVAMLPKPAPAPSSAPAVPDRPVPRRVRTARHVDVRAAQSPATSVIRIETPDPQVVILLLADGAPARSGNPGARE